MDNDTVKLIEHILFGITEVLPFVPFVGGNGILHTIVKGIGAILKKKLDE